MTDDSAVDLLLPLFVCNAAASLLFVLLFKPLPSFPFFFFVWFTVRLLCVFSLHGFTPDPVCQVQPWGVPAQLERGVALPSAEAVRPRSVPATQTGDSHSVLGGSGLED